MPGLFEQFPHTNLHELNLDWMIDLLNTFKDELENRAVLSVNGMTGEVTLYESENVVLPPLTDVSSWRLVRMMDGQYVGVLFQDGHVWLQQGNSTLKLLTTEDIPTSAGVVSINGLGGIVRLTGADIPIDNSADPDSVRLALENESIARQTADQAISEDLQTETNNRITFQNLFTKQNLVGVTAYQDRITGISGGFIKVGNLVFVDIIARTATAISANDQIISGMPAPNTIDLPIEGWNDSDKTTVSIVVATDGTLKAGAIPTGKYIIISGVYISST